jgi:ATP-dependent protease Clp ATPase subunit
MFGCLSLQVLAVAVHNHYKRLQNKRMHRAQEAQQQAQAAMVRRHVAWTCVA